MQLAQIQQSSNEFGEARDTYERMLTVSPNLVPALNNLAVLYSEKFGQLDKAADLANRAWELAPNSPHLADTLGWILFKKGEYSNALSLLKESAGKLPNEGQIQFHLGMVYHQLKQWTECKGALERALRLKLSPAPAEDAKRAVVDCSERPSQ
jgi:tetratricopeptide (TPR) repeat protein